MHYSELSGQTQQASASESQGSTEGEGQGSAAPTFNVNLGDDALARGIIGTDK